MVLRPVATPPPHTSSLPPPPTTTTTTTTTTSPPTRNDPGMQAAIAQAKLSLSEGGIPIGACLVGADGKIIGAGRNMRVQRASATLHAEIHALESSGRLPASAYKGATMYTTLSPCDMCTGACILYKVSRVVLGENANFVGGEQYLRERGVEVVDLDDVELKLMMSSWIDGHKSTWFEDIGEGDTGERSVLLER